MQAQRESKVKDGDSGEDESPAREKPPRPPARRKKSKEPLAEEDIIDGFAIMAFRTYEDLEVSELTFCFHNPHSKKIFNNLNQNRRRSYLQKQCSHGCIYVPKSTL